MVVASLKGMDQSLTDMGKRDKTAYQLDHRQRRYEREQDKRQRQDEKKVYDRLGTEIVKEEAKVKGDDQVAQMQAGIAASIAKAVKTAKPGSALHYEAEKGNVPGVTGGMGGGAEMSPVEALAPTGTSTPAPPPPVAETDPDVLRRLEELEETVFSFEVPDHMGFQSGGFTGAVPNLGQPTTGDHFYTHVEPGSYVLNRNAVANMGFQSGGNVPVALEQGEIVIPPGKFDEAALDFLNYQAYPRFQTGGMPQVQPAQHLHLKVPAFQGGGIVMKSHPDTGEGWSVGPDYKGRPSVLSKGAAEALQRMIKDSGGQVKTSDITSAKRSPEKNAAVGGVANSNHLTGNAMDIHGTSKAWLKEHGSKYGWKWLDYSGHDGHFDFVGAAGPPAPGETRANPEVEETRQETTSGPQAEQEAVSAQAQEQEQKEKTGFGGLIMKAIGMWIKAGDPENKFGLSASTFLGALSGNMGGLGFKAAVDKLTGGDSAAQAAGTPASRPADAAAAARGNQPVSLGAGGGSLKDMTQKQWEDLAYIVSGEAKRGTADEYGVAANVLTRVADPNYPNTIRGVGQQPGQYAAVTGIGHGITAHNDPALVEHLKKNQDKIAAAMKRLNGRADFRGTALYHNMGPNDVRFANGGNFYFYPGSKPGDPPLKNPPQHWKKWLGKQSGGRIPGGGGVGNMVRMRGDIMNQFSQNNMIFNEREAETDIQPMVVNLGGGQGQEPQTNVVAKTMKTNMPMHNLATRDNCPLSIYYRFHPSFNPQGMST